MVTETKCAHIQYLLVRHKFVDTGSNYEESKQTRMMPAVSLQHFQQKKIAASSHSVWLSLLDAKVITLNQSTAVR
jgi:hypothetical protein